MSNNYLDIHSIQIPTLVPGGYAVDDRGSVSFINDFDPSQYKRFYFVENFSKGFIRAWHGHLKESKAVLVTQGAALVAAKKIDSEEEAHIVTLDRYKPTILLIPAGYANGFKTLTEDAQLMFFSTSSLEESKLDDHRFPYDWWVDWGDHYR